jgi:hypothetical protein
MSSHRASLASLLLALLIAVSAANSLTHVHGEASEGLTTLCEWCVVGVGVDEALPSAGVEHDVDVVLARDTLPCVPQHPATDPAGSLRARAPPVASSLIT